MRKLFPLILITTIGCGSTGRVLFPRAFHRDCAGLPCDSDCGYAAPTGEIILKEYPVTETPSGENTDSDN